MTHCTALQPYKKYYYFLPFLIAGYKHPQKPAVTKLSLGLRITPNAVSFLSVNFYVFHVTPREIVFADYPTSWIVYAKRSSQSIKLKCSDQEQVSRLIEFSKAKQTHI